MPIKRPIVGVYGDKTRGLQKRLAYERVSQTWKFAFVYLYLGDRSNPEPALHDVGIKAFSEVPDRAYEDVPIEINIEFEALPEQSIDLSQYGIMDPMSNEQVFRVHVNSYEDLGRPIRTGDVIEMPFFERDGKKAFWEISDVDRNAEFEKYYSIVKANPLDDARETQEIPFNNSNAGILQDMQDDKDIEDADQVSHDGADTSGVQVEDPNEDMNEPFDPLDDTTGSFLDDEGKTW